jgi:Capsule polysaccharide biosynthesis protein
MLTRLATTWRWLASSSGRRRHAIVAEDFSRSKVEFGRIAHGAPAGNPAKIAWMVSSFTTVWGYKMEGALSLALRLSDFAPKAVYVSRDLWGHRYHRLFGLPRGHSLAPRLARSRDDGTAVAPQFLQGMRTVAALLSLTYEGVNVGRIALSNYLNRNKFSELNLHDTSTAQSIARDLEQIGSYVEAASKLVARERPAIVLLLEKGVTPMAELLGVCLREGIPVVQYAGAQTTDTYALKRYSSANATAHPFSLDEATWAEAKRMPWSRQAEDAIMAELAEGYRSGTWFNRKFLHTGKRIKPAAEVRDQLGLEASKKTAVIFSHVLWDATFFYGDGLFDDYESWLIETIRAAAANPRLNWIVKLHPDLIWKLKYEGFTGELRDVLSIRAGVGPLPPHVKIVRHDTDISTFSFFDITDYCLTVRGTIGIEMACHGVPVITGGTGRYSGLGFTTDSSTAAEYLALLSRIEELPPMEPRARELARRYAYTLFRRRPWHLRSFRTEKSIEMVGHPLDHNLVADVLTFDELAAATDMQAFAAWVDSAAVDYLDDSRCPE